MSTWNSNKVLKALSSLNPALASLQAVRISPDGAHVYVALNTGHTIYGFTRNASTGALVAIAGTPSVGAGGNNPYDIAISPDGAHLYCANQLGNNIGMFSRNASTGVLTAIGTIAAGTTATGIIVSPEGAHVYCINYGAGTISQYSRNATTGALTSLGATVATGANPYSIVIAPDGAHVYVVNSAGTSISQYSRNASTGVLTALTPATIATGLNHRGLLITPDGVNVYALNVNSNSFIQFSRNLATGLLTGLVPLYSSAMVGATPQFSAMSPDGNFVYCTTGSTVGQFARNANGTLSYMTEYSGVGAGTSEGLAVSPDGVHLIAAGGTSIYSMGFATLSAEIESSASAFQPSVAASTMFRQGTGVSVAVGPSSLTASAIIKMQSGQLISLGSGSAAPTLKVSPQFWA